MGKGETEDTKLFTVRISLGIHKAFEDYRGSQRTADGSVPSKLQTTEELLIAGLEAKTGKTIEELIEAAEAKL